VADGAAALEFTLRAAEVEPDAVSVVADGYDVTGECDVRLPRLHPVNRGDWIYRPHGGWSPGLHEVTVSWPGHLEAESWTFEIED